LGRVRWPRARRNEEKRRKKRHIKENSWGEKIPPEASYRRGRPKKLEGKETGDPVKD